MGTIIDEFLSPSTPPDCDITLTRFFGFTPDRLERKRQLMETRGGLHIREVGFGMSVTPGTIERVAGFSSLDSERE